MMTYNILLLGAGGREHALATKIVKSPLTKKLFCVPAEFTEEKIPNPALSQIADYVSADICNGEAILEVCKSNNIDFVVIGPEAPVAEGVSDILRAENIAVFGPSQAAAQLESSKGFTKELCKEANIPTASYDICHNKDEAFHALKNYSYPVVIKADGLAAGKGVIIAENEGGAIDTITDIFGGSFGAAGTKIVLETFLSGEEASFFVLCDGENIIPLTTAQDHKRAFDGDTGPNTGGMGAYSPAPVMTESITEKTIERIIKPTVAAMQKRGTAFQGVLYAGLMICDNDPFLIEYNVRFGDPECQVLMQRLESDIVPLLYGAATKFDDKLTAKWDNNIAITVVMAAEGYPSTPKKGGEITLPELQDQDCFIYHAGTALVEGKIIANGGRVLNINAAAENISIARDKAYNIALKVKWDDGFMRTDIGHHALSREKVTG